MISKIQVVSKNLLIRWNDERNTVREIQVEIWREGSRIFAHPKDMNPKSWDENSMKSDDPDAHPCKLIAISIIEYATVGVCPKPYPFRLTHGPIQGVGIIGGLAEMLYNMKSNDDTDALSDS